VRKNPFGLKTSVLENIADIVKRHPQVEKAILFGSRAKGTHHPGSDVDIALKGDSLNLAQLNQIQLELDDLPLPYTFDICIYHRIDNPDLRRHIQRVGKILYQRGRAGSHSTAPGKK
jgi:predicted nucleotidyltransferase